MPAAFIVAEIAQQEGLVSKVAQDMAETVTKLESVARLDESRGDEKQAAETRVLLSRLDSQRKMLWGVAEELPRLMVEAAKLVEPRSGK